MYRVYFKNFLEEEFLLEQKKEEEQTKKPLDILESVMESTIKNLLSGPVLNNFQGSVQASFLNPEGMPVSCSQEGLPKILSDQPFKLSVKFSPDLVEEEPSKNKTEGNFSERILIRDGEASPEVIFDVILDSETVTKVDQTKKSATIQTDIQTYHPIKDEELFFDLQAPNTDGNHKIWIEVYQKSKLIQVIPTEIIVESTTGEREQSATRNQLFISYSHQDRKWLTQLQTHLKPMIRNQTLDVWDDTKIKPGAEWRKEIETALMKAKVAVLLVSPNFLASDFIDKNELPPLLNAAEKEGLTIIWIPLTYSSYDETAIEKYQAVHNPSKPLDRLNPPERNKAWVDICQKIKTAMQSSKFGE